MNGIKLVITMLCLSLTSNLVHAATVRVPKTGQTSCYGSSGQISCSGTGQNGDYLTGATWPAPRFEENVSQTISDRLTGLIWTKDGNAPGPAACGPATTRNWKGALDYVDCLNRESYLGNRDWRLPNAEELSSLTNYEVARSDIWLQSAGFNGLSSLYYWSSSTKAAQTSLAWMVSLNGDVTYDVKTAINNVWPVRGGLKASFVAAPSTPTITSVVAGNGRVTIYFDAPVSDGGSAVTMYTVTSIPGNQAATGATSPVTIFGLENGKSYTFIVTATNAMGTGLSSTVSASVTPVDGPTSVPVMEGWWLLTGVLAGIGIINRRRKI